MNSRNSWAVRRSNLKLTERQMILTKRYYETLPQERLGFLKDLIEEARYDEPTLRPVLANQHFLRATFDTSPQLFLRKSRSYPNITKVANSFCRRYWNAGIIEVVLGKAPELETGEVSLGTAAKDVTAPDSKRESVFSIVYRKNKTKVPERPKENPTVYVNRSLSDLKAHL